MHLVSIDAYMLKGIEVRISPVNFQHLNQYVMAKGLEYVNFVDARMHLDKMFVAYYVMIGYGIITRLIQETYSWAWKVSDHKEEENLIALD